MVLLSDSSEGQLKFSGETGKPPPNSEINECYFMGYSEGAKEAFRGCSKPTRVGKEEGVFRR